MTFLARCPLVTALGLAIASAAPAADTIMVSEFQNNVHGSDPGHEWFEIHNYGNAAVDIGGWTVHDNNGASLQFTVPNGIVIPGQGVMVFAQNKTNFQNRWLGGAGDPRVLGGVAYNMNNTSNEQLVVKNADGTTVWTLGYTGNDGNYIGRAVYLTDTEVTRWDWGSAGSPGISFTGIDPMSGTLGYQRNANTPDPNAYTSTNGDIGSPLMVPGYTYSTHEIDSTAGTINGVATGTINGVPFTFDGIVNQIATFSIHGDLVLEDNDLVRGVGANGISLRVANDVDIAPGAIIDLSGTLAAAGAGGGDRGDGDQADSMFPSGGSGDTDEGDGGLRGPLGVGGPPCLAGLDGGNGLYGTNGSAGNDAPDVDTASFAGSSGIHSPSSGATFVSTSLAGGSGGPGGIRGSRGSGGDGGAAEENGDDGTNAGNAATPATAGPGTGGVDGLGGMNTGSGDLISGGGGGSGGTMGSGGGGGGSGGGGSGGGGGGGGGGCCLIWTGGGGGFGGMGGDGGHGGAGGRGGYGGHGGFGGGALEIIAYGRILGGGVLDAKGGQGLDGEQGPLGALGQLGQGGGNGAVGDLGSNCAANGGDGGDGGDGGRGGRGGTGGDGGHGGGGGGGTVKLSASIIDSATSVTVAGGTSSGAPGFAGRILLGHNLELAPVLGPLEGSAPETVAGPSDVNPFVEPATGTPYIADLDGGADVYGPTTLDASAFPDVIANAPVDAMAAIVRVDAGPGVHDDAYAGHDLVFFVSLDDAAVLAPSLGLGEGASLTELLVRGTVNNPDFGGGGAVALGQLDVAAVWMTLVPDAIDDVAASADGASVAFDDSMANGDVLYVVPGLGCPADVTGDGVVGFADVLAVIAAWGQAGGDADVNGSGLVGFDDVLAIVANWGACP
jgi:hypothetical protein